VPSVSDKQKRFMAAAANNPKFAKKADIPQSVAKDFFTADRHTAKMTAAALRRHGKN
jgi:hypothetical protein